MRRWARYEVPLIKSVARKTVHRQHHCQWQQWWLWWHTMDNSWLHRLCDIYTEWAKNGMVRFRLAWCLTTTVQPKGNPRDFPSKWSQKHCSWAVRLQYRYEPNNHHTLFLVSMELCNRKWDDLRLYILQLASNVLLYFFLCLEINNDNPGFLNENSLPNSAQFAYISCLICQISLILSNFKVP